MRAEANAIIVKLMQSTELDNCIKKVDPHLQDDLKAELALALLETDPEKIVLLFNRDSLRFYAVRIIINMTSATGPFYKKFKLCTNKVINPDMRVNHDLIEDSPETNRRWGQNFKLTISFYDHHEAIKEKLELEEKALSEIDNLDWYEAEMVKLYLDVGNYRDMQKATRIPYVSCFNTVKTAVKRIKSRL